MLLLAGCEGPASVLDPAGPAAAAVARLWWVMLWASLALFGLVVVLLAVAVWRRTPASESTRLWLVGGGLVLPGVILPLLLGYAIVVGEQLLARGDGAIPVQVVARQWQWTFYYGAADEARASDGVLHMPAGRPVDLQVSSVDVIHSFWIPRLGGKIDAIPGRTNVLRLVGSEPGRFLGLCAEFCGTGHTGMSVAVQVHEADDYRRAIEGLRRATPDEVDRRRGRPTDGSR